MPEWSAASGSGGCPRSRCSPTTPGHRRHEATGRPGCRWAWPRRPRGRRPGPGGTRLDLPQTLKRISRTSPSTTTYSLPSTRSLPDVAGGGPRAQRKQLVPMDDLGPDEAALEVGMDHSGALWRLGPRPERPGPAFLVARGEKGAPAEHPVRGLGHPGQGALTQAEALQQSRPGPLQTTGPPRLRA